MSNPNQNHSREPLIRMASRNTMSRGKAWGIRILSILAALLIGAILFLCLGYDPVSVYIELFKGALGSGLAVQQTIKIAIPLLGAAIAIAPAFRMKFWNIGVEGQITMGAVFSSYFALTYGDVWPTPLLLVVMFLAGAVGGAVWGLIPAIFKAKWGTNETLFTLMLNYIAIGLVKYLQGGPWEDPSRRGSQQIQMFADGARMPTISKTTAGVFIVLVLTVAMFCYMKYSKQGYQIHVVGESENTARYAGINVPAVICRTMAVSGAVSGITGFIIVSGINYTLNDAVAGGVGFTGITVAWLAQLNTFAMVIIALLLAVLERGASSLASLTGNFISDNMSDVLTGLILFCMLGCEFFIRYRLIFRKRKPAESGKEATEQ